MIKHASHTMMVCVLLSVLAVAAVYASETRGAAVDGQKARVAQPAQPGQPAQPKPRRAVGMPIVTQPGTPAARKLYQHTTSMGTTCCAPCEEIAANGSCKTWGQCSPNVNICDAWTN